MQNRHNAKVPHLRYRVVAPQDCMWTKQIGSLPQTEWLASATRSPPQKFGQKVVHYDTAPKNKYTIVCPNRTLHKTNNKVMRFETGPAEVQSLRRTDLRTDESADELQVKIVNSVCKEIVKSAKSKKDKGILQARQDSPAPESPKKAESPQHYDPAKVNYNLCLVKIVKYTTFVGEPYEVMLLPQIQDLRPQFLLLGKRNGVYQQSNATLNVGFDERLYCYTLTIVFSESDIQKMPVLVI